MENYFTRAGELKQKLANREPGFASAVGSRKPYVVVRLNLSLAERGSIFRRSAPQVGSGILAVIWGAVMGNLSCSSERRHMASRLYNFYPPLRVLPLRSVITFSFS